MSDSGTAPGRPGEFELIANLFASLAREFPGAYGFEDDVAYLALTGGLVQPGEELVLKTDAIVSGVHFLASDPGDLVARKLLLVNLSDLAAKGGTAARLHARRNASSFSRIRLAPALRPRPEG